MCDELEQKTERWLPAASQRETARLTFNISPTKKPAHLTAKDLLTSNCLLVKSKFLYT